MANVNKLNRCHGIWIICRICLKNPDTEMQKIFGDGDDAEETNSELASRIEECGGIQLDIASNLPDSICAKCLLLLKAAHKFRTTSQRSQQKLLKLLQLDVSSSSVSLVAAEEEMDDQVEQHVEEKPRAFDDECDYAVDIGFMVKQENVVSLHSSADVSDQEDLGYIMDENITEEYIELQSEPIDFLQDDSTQNFVSDDMSYTPDQFEAVRATQNPGYGTQYEVVVSCDALQLSEEDVSGGKSAVRRRKRKVKLCTRQQTDALIEDLKKSSNEYKIVPKVSSVNCGSDRVSQRSRKTKRATAGTSMDQGDSYICPHCGNTYLERAKLTLHMKNHTSIKPHECEICHKRFAQTPQLTRHMNTHTGNRPFKCKFCGSRFADPSTCVKHERIHTNERPYKCDTCGKSFSYSNVLKVHIMMHTGEKPYTCAYCGKKFSQLHHKKAHERTHNHDLEVKSDCENLESVGDIF